MDDALDEADEIYQLINEEMPSQEQEILMQLFSKDKLNYDVASGTNPSGHISKFNRNGNQLTALDAEIDKIGGQENYDSMPSGSSGKSSGLKRPYDALDIGNGFDLNEGLRDQSIPERIINSEPKQNLKTKYLASAHHQKGGDSLIKISKDKEKRKRQLVRNYFRNQLNLGKKSTYRIPWDILDPTDFVNWPENLEIKSPEKYKGEELTLIFSQLENIRWSERFLQRNTVEKHVSDSYSKNNKNNSSFKRKPGIYHYRRKLIYDHFQKLLLLNNLNQKRIEWTKLNKSDFINWPDNLEIKAPFKYNSEELSILLSKLEEISFNADYLHNIMARKHKI